MSPIQIQTIDFENLRTQTLQPVQLAVIDSGVDSTHPDLQSRVVSAWRATRIDAETFAAVEQTVPGMQDQHEHGTAVAGIIAQLAPNAVLHDYKIFAEGETSSGEGFLACLEHAINAGAQIINMSLAVNAKWHPQIARLLEKAYRHGILLVASQRNFPIGDLGLPAELSYCVGVNLHTEVSPYVVHYRPDHLIPFIGRGQNIDVPLPGGRYGQVTGTSFATPTISALCALLLGAYPELEPFEIKTILKNYSR